MKITTGDPNFLLAGVRNGALDVAVTVIATQAPRDEDLIEERLYDEEYVIYASANHRLAKRRQLTLADLAQERWALPSLDTETVRLLTQAFGNLGLPPPNVAIEVPYLPARYRLVATSYLLASGSKAVARYVAGLLGIVELRVKGLSRSQRVGVMYRKDAYLPPAALRFIEILKATAKEIAAKKP